MISRICNKIFILLTLFTISSSAIAVPPYSIVARTGDHAPGTPQGVEFAFFVPPMFNSTGQYAISAYLQGPGIQDNNESSIWIGEGDQLELVVQSGGPAPGTPNGVNFRTLGDPTFNDHGEVVFTGFLEGPGTDFPNGSGVWRGTPNNLYLVARSGEHPPGSDPDIVLTSIRAFFGGINTLDETLIGGTLFDTSEQRIVGNGVYLHTNQGLELVVKTGDPAPGFPPGVNIETFIVPLIDNSGTIYFSARTSIGNVLWSGRPGNFNVLVKPGDSIDGLPEGVEYTAPIMGSLNFSNEISFFSRFMDTVTGFEGGGVFSGSAGSFLPIALSGDHAPGTPTDVSFLSASSPYHSAGSDVVFFGRVGGPSVDLSNDSGIWIGQPGSVSLAAREGDQAVGFPIGVVYSALSGIRPAINGIGSLLFEGGVSSGQQSLWRGSPGSLDLVIKTGDFIKLDKQEEREVTFLNVNTVAGAQDGRRNSLRFDNVVGMVVSFEDFSEALLLICEPKTLNGPPPSRQRPVNNQQGGCL